MQSESVPGIPGQIGHFRIVRELGRGGMGIVYLGERTQDFEQRVAIKVLYANVLGDLQEALILRSLDHPGIVRILDSGRLPQGTPFLVMEYVNGIPIADHCARRQLGQAQRIDLLLQAAEAVAYAHSRFVTHSDLKPGNLFVTQEGEVKLLDFGIAISPTSDSTREPLGHHTPEFASPEQQFGGTVTVATDIYSFGKTAAALLSQLPEPIPADLRAILTKASRPEPEARYRTMRELAADLRAFLEHRPVLAHRGDQLYRVRRWSQRNQVSAALLLCLLLVIVGSTVGITVQTVRAVHSRRLTQARLDELVALTGTLQGELYHSLPDQPPAAAARRALLDHVSQTLDQLAGENADDPRLASALAVQYQSLARLLQAQGQTLQAQHDLLLAHTILNH